MAFEDPATIAAIVLVVTIACVIVIYAMRKLGKKPAETPRKSEAEPDLRGLPFKVTKSVQKKRCVRRKR